MILPLCSCQGAQAPPQRREAERAEELRKLVEAKGNRSGDGSEADDAG